LSREAPLGIRPVECDLTRSPLNPHNTRIFSQSVGASVAVELLSTVELSSSTPKRGNRYQRERSDKSG